MHNSAVLFLEESARRFPGRVAVEDGARALTYRALRALALAGGTALLARKAAAYAREAVVVLLPKSALCPAAFQAALYAGCCYVPLDYHIPDGRLASILAELAPLAVVTDEAGLARLAALAPEAPGVLWDALAAAAPDEARCLDAVAHVCDGDPVYIMFTSGSTGKPKGVVIPHRGVVDYAGWVVSAFGFTEETVNALHSPFYFDNSVLNLYGTLASGARMVIIPEPLFLFPQKLPDFLAEHGVDLVFWVPTVMAAVAQSGALERRPLPKLTRVLFCGEVMPNGPLNVWRRALPHALFANLYGPTEITDVCTYYIPDRAFADADSLPIGRPCRNTGILVLTEDGRAAAPGEMGEICVTGAGLALGYWNDPEKTARAFCPNPLSPHYPERMYRTGDLGWWAEDGNLMIAGRMDSQIKHNGNRIELGDIEAAARCVAGVKNACALFDAAANDIVLAAAMDEPLPLRKFNLALRRLLPAYMLPTRLVTMAELPLTPNGKLDRAGLKASLLGGAK